MNDFFSFSASSSVIVNIFEKIRNGDVDVDKTFNQSEAEMIKQKIEELKADINKSKKVNVEVTVGDEEVKKKESKELNPK